MIIVVPANNKLTTTQTLLNYFGVDTGIRIVENGADAVAFHPLPWSDILNSGSETDAYLISNRESRGSIYRKLHAAGQMVVAEYSALSGWENPRWFIPTWRSLSLGLMPRMISPTRFIAKAGVTAFRMLRGCGGHQLLFPCRVFLAASVNNEPITYDNHGNNDFSAICKGTIGCETKPGVVYTGSYGPLQKFTLELLDKTGFPIAYAKFGHDALTRQAINREDIALKELGSVPLRTLKVPKCHGIFSLDRWGDEVLIQSSLDGGSPVYGISNTIVRALSDLFEGTRRPHSVSVKEYALMLRDNLMHTGGTNLSPDQAEFRDDIVKILTTLCHRVGKAMMPIAMSHGDFTRWNMKKGEHSIYVVDWEEAALRPPGHDYFHFLLIENLLVQQQSPELVAQKMLFTTLNQKDDYSSEYFNHTVGLDWLEIKVFALLFLAETARVNLWHIEQHNNMHFPPKKSIDDILKTAWMASRQLAVIQG
jgi:hypothetical protein